MMLDSETKRVEIIKTLDEKMAELSRCGNELLDTRRRLEESERASGYFQNKLKELESKSHLSGIYGSALVDLNNARMEASKVLGLDQKIKIFENTVFNMGSEKQDLTILVTSLRDQLNEMEDEKTDAINDEGLMKEKLKFVVKEKEILGQKIKNLEGLYKSELGEIHHAEEVLKKLKKAELDLEFMKKNETLLRREKAELLQILQGTKDQLSQIEGQRDHFEDAHDRIAEDLQRAINTHNDLLGTHQDFIVGQTNIEVATTSLVHDMRSLKTRLAAVEEEKKLLHEENKDLQARLDDHVDRIYAMEENPFRKSDSIEIVRANIQRSTVMENSLDWLDLENILRYKLSLEIPQATDPKILIDCVDQLADSLSEEKMNINILQNQVIELRADKINLLEKLEKTHSTLDVSTELAKVVVPMYPQVVVDTETRFRLEGNICLQQKLR